ncbi:carboxymuconolactone decarboxylase family protein [Christiangramia salexigens]|nr:carboxymuconolactone decarboxylase family protein [Christiangramia salexigens]
MISYEEASPELKEIYDDIKKTLQLPFVLNWFKCQGSNPALLKGNWNKLKYTLMQGEVPNVLKQLILYNISKERGCEYCSHTYGFLADQKSSEISEAENFRATEKMTSPTMPVSYRTAIKVITRVALNPDQTSNDDFEELVAAGFSDTEIQELMAQADLANMLNTISEVSGIKINQELSETFQ